MKGNFIVKILFFYGHGLVPILQYIETNMMWTHGKLQCIGADMMWTRGKFHMMWTRGKFQCIEAEMMQF